MEARLESELIADGRNGDREALSELFERNYASSMRVARRILGSNEEACDAVQSAYLAALEHFGSFRGDSQFNTWITSIVKNQCFMYFRGGKRRGVSWNLEEDRELDAEIAAACPTPTPEDLAWRSQADTILCDAVRKLPKPLRDVYLICGIAEARVREAADTLGLSMPAAKARLFRAQHHIRGELRRKLLMRPTLPPAAVRDHAQMAA